MLKIEKNLDRAASALFALACGYAGFSWLPFDASRPMLGAATAAIVALAYLMSTHALKAIEPKPRKLAVPIFDLRRIESLEVPELLLTELHEPTISPEEPLLLDDILGEIGPDSRVVRLFDPSTMPTPGQLDAQIRHRLARSAASLAPHDASQALHEALAELRRSLG